MPNRRRDVGVERRHRRRHIRVERRHRRRRSGVERAAGHVGAGEGFGPATTGAAEHVTRPRHAAEVGRPVVRAPQTDVLGRRCARPEHHQTGRAGQNHACRGHRARSGPTLLRHGVRIHQTRSMLLRGILCHRFSPISCIGSLSSHGHWSTTRASRHAIDSRAHVMGTYSERILEFWFAISRPSVGRPPHVHCRERIMAGQGACGVSQATMSSRNFTVYSSRPGVASSRGRAAVHTRNRAGYDSNSLGTVATEMDKT